MCDQGAVREGPSYGEALDNMRRSSLGTRGNLHAYPARLLDHTRVLALSEEREVSQ